MKGSEGYFLAKRQLQDSLAYRITVYEKHMEAAEMNGDASAHSHAKVRRDELETVRNYVRNVMLWDTKNGD